MTKQGREHCQFTAKPTCRCKRRSIERDQNKRWVCHTQTGRIRDNLVTSLVCKFPNWTPNYFCSETSLCLWLVKKNHTSLHRLIVWFSCLLFARLLDKVFACLWLAKQQNEYVQEKTWISLLLSFIIYHLQMFLFQHLSCLCDQLGRVDKLTSPPL